MYTYNAMVMVTMNVTSGRSMKHEMLVNRAVL